MNIRQVRKKIKSVSNVKKITKAMEMVSVIKMKKAQSEAVQARPYQENLEQIINKLTGKIDPKFSSLLQAPLKPVGRELSIVISTNKGLCGAYNFNLYRFMVKNTDFKTNDFIVIGKKGALFVSKMGGNLVADFTQPTPVFEASAIFKLIVDGFLSRKYDKVNIFYNQFVSTLKNTPAKEVLLPAVYKREEEVVKATPEEYMVEPDPKKLIDQLLRSYVEEKVRNCLIQAAAGEHSSRMISMKNATENAEHVIYNLTLLRNKIRQEKITYELLDMTTAKESVEN